MKTMTIFKATTMIRWTRIKVTCARYYFSSLAFSLALFLYLMTVLTSSAVKWRSKKIISKLYFFFPLCTIYYDCKYWVTSLLYSMFIVLSTICYPSLVYCCSSISDQGWTKTPHDKAYQHQGEGQIIFYRMRAKKWRNYKTGKKFRC